MISSVNKYNTWLSIEYDTFRMKVFGGWLIKTYEERIEENPVFDDRGEKVTGYDNKTKTIAITSSITFMPDPEHMWDQWSEAQEMGITLTELINPGGTNDKRKDP